MMRPLLAVLATAIAGCSAMPIADTSPGAPSSLARAESEFAAQSVREGMRAAFLAWFAPDATLFRNGPVNGPAAIAANPDPPIVLDWRPAFVEVSSSGEMGLSTGPWKITSRKDPSAPPRHGQFVSIWKRAGEGPWRVHVDLGISHPGPALAEAPLQAATTPAVVPSRPAGTIAAAEAQFALRARAAGDAAAYAEWVSSTVRIYREGRPPFLGREAALASFATGNAPVAWTVDRNETSIAGDFGYSSGRYAPPGGHAAGHFVRVWRLEPAGWRIALDVVNELPTR
jgi:ketosteroid isomerase-like protein